MAILVTRTLPCGSNVASGLFWLHSCLLSCIIIEGGSHTASAIHYLNLQAPPHTISLSSTMHLPPPLSANPSSRNLPTGPKPLQPHPDSVLYLRRLPNGLDHFLLHKSVRSQWNTHLPLQLIRALIFSLLTRPSSHRSHFSLSHSLATSIVPSIYPFRPPNPVIPPPHLSSKELRNT